MDHDDLILAPIEAESKVATTVEPQGEPDLSTADAGSRQPSEDTSKEAFIKRNPIYWGYTLFYSAIVVAVCIFAFIRLNDDTRDEIHSKPAHVPKPTTTRSAQHGTSQPWKKNQENQSEIAGRVKMLMKTARVQWEQGEFAKVIDSCSGVLSIDANHAQALRARAHAYASLHNWAKAVEDHSTLLAIDTDMAMIPSSSLSSAYTERARTMDRDAKELIDQSNLRGAIEKQLRCLEHCTIAQELDPDDEAVSTFQARAADWLTKYKTALNHGEPDHLKLRDWRDHTGRFSTLARFVNIDNLQVVLECEDGSRKSVSLDSLSIFDRNWAKAVAEWDQQHE